jgi:hypothetical protein
MLFAPYSEDCTETSHGDLVLYRIHNVLSGPYTPRLVIIITLFLHSLVHL